MHNTQRKPVKKKTVSPLVIVIVIVVVIGVAVLIGMNFLKPKPAPFVGTGNKTMYKERERIANAWAAEQKLAAQEGRQPNPDLQPFMSPGIAETMGSARQKGMLGNSRRMRPGAADLSSGNGNSAGR